MKDAITVQTVVNAPMEKVWECWNKPEHITGWAFASDDWEAPTAENDLRIGGKFKPPWPPRTRARASILPAFTLTSKITR